MRRLRKHCCPECGTVNPPPLGKVYQGRRFCDRSCYYAWHKKEMSPQYVRRLP